jgi:hypothetical protein
MPMFRDAPRKHTHRPIEMEFRAGTGRRETGKGCGQETTKAKGQDRKKAATSEGKNEIKVAGGTDECRGRVRRKETKGGTRRERARTAERFSEGRCMG